MSNIYNLLDYPENVKNLPQVVPGDIINLNKANGKPTTAPSRLQYVGNFLIACQFGADNAADWGWSDADLKSLPRRLQPGKMVTGTTYQELIIAKGYGNLEEFMPNNSTQYLGWLAWLQMSQHLTGETSARSKVPFIFAHPEGKLKWRIGPLSEKAGIGVAVFDEDFKKKLSHHARTEGAITAGTGPSKQRTARPRVIPGGPDGSDSH